MNVNPEVLTVLSELEVEVTQVRIATQLDRKMYSKVNAVLEAIGGTWSRKAKAHVFKVDPRDVLDRVITTGEVETGPDLGWFATPPALAAELVAAARVNAGDHVLEPSAGEGAIVQAIQDAGGIVTAVEYDAGRREVLLRDVLKGRDTLAETPDFMNYWRGRSNRESKRSGLHERSISLGLFDRVVMNPPFCRVGIGDHLDHVRHAFEMLAQDGVLVSVLPSSVEFRRDRRYREFREWVDERKEGEITSIPAGSFKASGTSVNTCMVRIVR